MQKVQLGNKNAQGVLELRGQRAKIIDPLNRWNEWLAMASSSALEVHVFSLRSDFTSHPIKGPQTWSAFTSSPGIRHSHCIWSTNSKSWVPFSALPLTWLSLKSSFLDGPSVWQRLDCMSLLRWVGDGKEKPLSKHRPKPPSSKPPARSPDLLHKNRIPSLLISPRSQDSCCYHVDIDKLPEKTWGSPTSPALLWSMAWEHFLKSW